MANFIDEFINNRKNILIPSLQRDYVQGGRDYVINPFLDELRSALLGEKKVDLNYIYGSTENFKVQTNFSDGQPKNNSDEAGQQDNFFVPIDGQQRLITLWLLYLFLYIMRGEHFPVELHFDSREFANEFSLKVKDKLDKFINSKNIKEDIIDSPWFVSGWLYDTTVRNMLNTLDYISKKFDTINFDSNKYYFDNITFSFLDMNQQGLTDDTYIKMNGRGRPLSYFENLKSWMDEKVPKTTEKNENSENSWQTKMDNKWTDFFWRNRNKNQEHQEEIDDEQVRLFYTLVLLYWLQEEKDFSKTMEEKLKPNPLDKELLMKYLNLDENEFSAENAQEKIFTALHDCKELIPLYWIEKTGLFEEEIFKFIETALDNLCQIDSNGLLSSELHLFLNERNNGEKERVSYMYQIAMETATYETTIPYLIALINTPDKYRKEGNENFSQWIRFFRNLIENTSIGKDDISRICASIKALKEIAEKSDKDFYNAIIDSKTEYDNLKGFSPEQLDEEYEKSKKMIESPEIKQNIEEMERYAFFKGAIRFLFRDENGNFNWDNFDKKMEKAKRYFDAEGVKDCEANKYKSDVLLLKALLSRSENTGKISNTIYNNNRDNWRKLLLDDDWARQIHDILMGNLEIKDNNIEPLIDSLCKDKGVLKYISEDRNNAWLRFHCKFFAFWVSGYPRYMIPFIPISIDMKSNDLITYREDCSIPNSNWATCNNYEIDFSYKDKNSIWHNFLYYMCPDKNHADIYLKDDNWDCIKTGKESDDEHISYYCSDFDNPYEKNEEEFKKVLDELVGRKC